MKFIFTLLILSIALMCSGQDLETGMLWRTRGIYDSLGNFIERAKIQSFLYVADSNQIHRLFTQDKINMETGETKVFEFRDTLDLVPVMNKFFKISEEESIAIHSQDSLTIESNSYHISYVKLLLPRNKVNTDELKNFLFKETVCQTVEDKTEYQLKYQQNGLVKVSVIGSRSEWESEYKILTLNGYPIIQGITSAPKLVLNMDKNKIEFIEIDYRFENKMGVFEKVR